MPAPGRPWLTTDRVVLRPPVPGDLDDYVRLHTDPRTYAHAPHTMPDTARCRERLDADLADWETVGLGYAAVVDRATHAVVGWAGLRRKDSDAGTLNLYYRLGHDRLGAGLGREIARALVVWAAENRPGEPVTAMVDPVNVASLATARAAGLGVVGTKRHPDDPPDAEPMVHLEAPRVRTESVDEDPEELVALWLRVNDAGGAVGFLPGADRGRVQAAFDRHAALVRSGQATLTTVRDPDTTLRGFGFWEHAGEPGFAHVATLKRLMVDPVAQGRNLGAVALAGMVGIARRDLPRIRLLLLDYRSGLGLGDFYGRYGWVEVGRLPRAIQVGVSDYRDDVFMARRPDGSDLAPDGRT